MHGYCQHTVCYKLNRRSIRIILFFLSTEYIDHALCIQLDEVHRECIASRIGHDAVYGSVCYLCGHHIHKGRRISCRLHPIFIQPAQRLFLAFRCLELYGGHTIHQSVAFICHNFVVFNVCLNDI